MNGGKVMDQREIQQLVEMISLKYFNKPFFHTASFNARLKTTGGRYILQSHNIELNQRYYDELGFEELVKIIKHELVHYHLHLEGKGYKHRDPEFKQLLQKVGGARFCGPLPSRKKQVAPVKYHYKCTSCNQKYDRKRRVNISKFVCGKCRGKLQEI